MHEADQGPSTFPLNTATNSQSKLELNTAGVEELSKVSDISVNDLEYLIKNRPYRDWGEVRRVSGISESFLLKLQDCGVIIKT